MAEPNSNTVLASIITASCCSTRATAGPTMGMWCWVAYSSISASTSSRLGSMEYR